MWRLFPRSKDDELKPLLPDDALSQNLFCLECGYNLRGLSGDPRPCPECGHENALSDLFIPAEIIQRQLTRLETWPTLSFLGILLLGLGVLSSIGRIPLIPNALILAATCLTIVSIGAFGRACRWRSGWITVLALFYLVFVLVFGAIGPLAWAGSTLGSGPMRNYVYWGGLALFAFGGMFIQWPYGYARRRLAELQRATAVELAKPELDKRMHRKR